MRKSEFIERRRKHWRVSMVERLVSDDVKAAEEAGAFWDEENHPAVVAAEKLMWSAVKGSTSIHETRINEALKLLDYYGMADNLGPRAIEKCIWELRDILTGRKNVLEIKGPRDPEAWHPDSAPILKR